MSIPLEVADALKADAYSLLVTYSTVSTIFKAFLKRQRSTSNGVDKNIIKC